MFDVHRNKVNSSPVRMIASVLVSMLGLCYCSSHNHTFLGIPELHGPSEALVKDIIVLQCKVLPHPENEIVLLQLFRNETLLSEYTSLSGEPGYFNLIVTPSHGGSLKCVARAQNNTHIQPTVSNTHYLKVIVPVKGTRILVFSGQVEFFEGQTLVLFCTVTDGTHVSFKWLLNDEPIYRSADVFVFHRHLWIHRATPANSGSYMCVASNSFNKVNFTSRSSKVVITVKGVVSAPDISFTVLKGDSHNYSAVVTCQSIAGSPPVEFSLYNGTQLVANVTSEDRSALFNVPVVLGEYLGKFRCQAYNGEKIVSSQWLPLEIEKVKGPVSLRYDYDIAKNFVVVGVRLYCKAAGGSHLRYQWFLNNTLLQDHGSFYVLHQSPEQSILILSVGRSSAGTYHCVVSNSFDNTIAISSRKQYLDKEVLNRLPVLVVAVVFGCFIFLILLVCICCGLGVVYRRMEYGDESLLEMERTVVAYEGEPDLSEYSEGADVLTAAVGDDFDQASETSEDEWPQIAVRKKTIEDDPVDVPLGFK